MLIDTQTKIATLLKQHPDALEAIVALSPDFKKLRNPILRALMAKRTSIAMAAKLGGCRPEDFFKALAPLGFEVAASPEPDGEVIAREPEPKPPYLQNLPVERLVSFDARAMLEEGDDPLKAIQKKVKALAPEEVLLIVNNFEPVPLIKLLERQGFHAYVNFIDADTIETYFYRPIGTPALEVELGEEDEGSSGDWPILLKQYAGNLVEVDVRHLEMPMPMMTILENLEVLAEGKALFVSHKRIPVFLLTELKERAFDYRIKKVQEDEVYLLIFKKNNLS